MEKNIIFVRNFITYCLIGVYPEEKKNKQKIKVSVKLNIKRRITSDKLSSTVCYQNILNSLENIHKKVKFYKADIEDFNKLNQILKKNIKKL